MSFGLYLVGYVVVICGLVWAATMMNVPARWIAVGAIVMAGIAIVSGVRATRQKDSS